MIYSASYWKDVLSWTVEVECDAIPSSVFLVHDDESETSVSFDVIGPTRIKLYASTRTSVLRIRLDGDTRVISFTEGASSEQHLGEVPLPTSIGLRRDIFIPYCDFSNIQLEVYHLDGARLQVEQTLASPWWEVIPDELHYQTISGRTMLCWRLSLGLSNTAQYLVSPETNTWEPLNSVPYRVIIRGLSRPSVDPLTYYNIDDTLLDDDDNDIFYNRVFYADFELGGELW